MGESATACLPDDNCQYRGIGPRELSRRIQNAAPGNGEISIVSGFRQMAPAKSDPAIQAVYVSLSLSLSLSPVRVVLVLVVAVRNIRDSQLLRKRNSDIPRITERSDRRLIF